MADDLFPRTETEAPTDMAILRSLVVAVQRQLTEHVGAERKAHGRTMRNTRVWISLFGMLTAIATIVANAHSARLQAQETRAQAAETARIEAVNAIAANQRTIAEVLSQHDTNVVEQLDRRAREREAARPMCVRH
jgi:hypothetical protein